MDKVTFQKAYREYMEEGGHSYDQWDLAVAYDIYQKDPTAYDFLTLEGK